MLRRALLLLSALTPALHAQVTNSEWTLDLGVKARYDRLANPLMIQNLYGLDRLWTSPAEVDANQPLFLRSQNVLDFKIDLAQGTSLAGKVTVMKNRNSTRYGFDAVTGSFRRIDENNSFLMEENLVGSDFSVSLPLWTLRTRGLVDAIRLGSQVPMFLTPYALNRSGFGLSVDKKLGPVDLSVMGSRWATTEDGYPTRVQGTGDLSLSRKEYGGTYLLGAKASLPLDAKGWRGGFDMGAMMIFRDAGIGAAGGGRRLYLKVRSTGSSTGEIATLIDMTVTAGGRTIPLSDFKLVDETRQTRDAFGVAIPNETTPGAQDAYNNGSYIYEVSLIPPLTEGEFQALARLEVAFRLRGRYVLQVSPDLVSWTTLFDRSLSYGPLAGTDSDDPKRVWVKRLDFAAESALETWFARATVSRHEGDTAVNVQAEAGLNREVFQNRLFSESLPTDLGSLSPYLDASLRVTWKGLSLQGNGWTVPPRFASDLLQRKNTLNPGAGLGLVADQDSGYGAWADNRQKSLLFDGNLLPSSPYFRDSLGLTADWNHNGTPDDLEYDRRGDLPQRPGSSGFRGSLDGNLTWTNILAVQFSAGALGEALTVERSSLDFVHSTAASNLTQIQQTNESWRYYSRAWGLSGTLRPAPDLKFLETVIYGQMHRSRDGIPDSSLDNKENGAKSDVFGSLYRMDAMPGFDNLLVAGGGRLKLSLEREVEKSILSRLFFSAEGFAEFRSDTHYSNGAYLAVMNGFVEPFLQNLPGGTAAFPNPDLYRRTATALESQQKVGARIGAKAFGDRLTAEASGEWWNYDHSQDPDPLMNRQVQVWTARARLDWSTAQTRLVLAGSFQRGIFSDLPDLNQDAWKAAAWIDHRLGNLITMNLKYEYTRQVFSVPATTVRAFHTGLPEDHMVSVEFKSRLGLQTREKAAALAPMPDNRPTVVVIGPGARAFLSNLAPAVLEGADFILRPGIPVEVLDMDGHWWFQDVPGEQAWVVAPVPGVSPKVVSALLSAGTWTHRRVLPIVWKDEGLTLSDLVGELP